jgi:general secretion pathway protein D
VIPSNCTHVFHSLRRGLLAAGITLLLFSSGTRAQESATLNLNDADIRVLINTVSKVTGKNFIIDPRVKARVTVVSAKPMAKDELYEVFLSILQVHGFAAVPGEGITKIVPDVNAKQDSIPMGVRSKDSDQLVTQVIPLENVPANQLVPILRPLIPQQGHLAAYTPTNVLVISDRASNISRIMQIIRRIDRPDNDEIDIVKLEHASATEIVRIVSAIQQQEQRDAGGNILPGSAKLMADERTNSILITGDKASRTRVRGIIVQLDTPLQSGGNTKVIFLKYAAAKDMVTIIKGVSEKTAEQQQGQPAGAHPSAGRAQIDIQADEANNALVITAPSSVIRELESIIRQLDIPRAQVLIEAIIAEVSTDLANELGSQLVVDGSDDGKGPLGGIVFPQSFNLGALASQTTGAGALGNTSGMLLGVGRQREDGTDFAFILKALKGDAATNILSTPTLVTLDNVEAEIVFGQNVPFVTGSFSNTGGGGSGGGNVNPFQTIERQDVGLTLKVKPQINEGTAIKLQIEQEVSSITTSAVTTSDVVTNKRSIKTEVLVEDGQIIVLGGLIEDQFIDTKQKVPVLGSIPILGHLFSFTKTQKIKRNLMVFIRPIILAGQNSADYVTSQKYSLLRARQLEANIDQRGLIKDSAARLPDIEVLFTPMPPQTKNKKKPVPQPEPVSAAPIYIPAPAPAPEQPAAAQPAPVPATTTIAPAPVQPSATEPAVAPELLIETETAPPAVVETNPQPAEPAALPPGFSTEPPVPQNSEPTVIPVDESAPISQSPEPAVTPADESVPATATSEMPAVTAEPSPASPESAPATEPATTESSDAPTE